MRWACRYSSSEMQYIEIVDDEVRQYFDHSTNNAAVWSFRDVLEGSIDADVRNTFEPGTIEEIKDAVREAMNRNRR